tara:strand:+ start:198 stop:1058 length:861 start_codon:yes stop_codon:yes gene_type:complete
VSLYIKTLRPWQWTKNLILFIPYLLFNKSIEDDFIFLIAVFLNFSLFVSSTYIFNDIKDRNIDKYHKVKSLRPIASEKISLKNAKIYGTSLFISNLLVSYILNPNLTILFLIYASLTFIYSNYGKFIFILDTFLISLMFLLRIFIGGRSLEISITSELTLFIFFTSCLLSISKKISIINTSEIVKSNNYYQLLIAQNKKIKFQKLYLLLSFCAIFSFLFWLSSEYENIKDLIFLFSSFIFYTIFISNILKLSEKGLLEDFSKELLKNKKLLLLGILIASSFFIGYF